MTDNIYDLTTILSVIWICLFVFLLVAVIKNTAASNRYVQLLRSGYPKQWAKINNDNMITGEAKTQLNLLLFLLKKEFNPLNDEIVISEGELLRKYLIIYFFVCFWFFVLTGFLLI